MLFDVNLSNKWLTIDQIISSIQEKDINFKNIWKINLMKNNIELSDMMYLNLFRNVINLNLSYNNIGDIWVIWVIWLINLEVLKIQHCNITDIGAKLIWEYLDNLQVLDLSWNNITDDSIEYLSTLENLDTLNLSNTKIIWEKLEYLLRIPEFKHLLIKWNKLSEKWYKNLIHLKAKWIIVEI